MTDHFPPCPADVYDWSLCMVKWGNDNQQHLELYVTEYWKRLQKGALHVKIKFLADYTTSQYSFVWYPSQSWTLPLSFDMRHQWNLTFDFFITNFLEKPLPNTIH